MLCYWYMRSGAPLAASSSPIYAILAISSSPLAVVYDDLFMTLPATGHHFYSYTSTTFPWDEELDVWSGTATADLTYHRSLGVDGWDPTAFRSP